MGTQYELLTSEKRSTIMLMRRDNHSCRSIAQILHRSPSTNVNEIKRFVPDDPIDLAYDASLAGRRARRCRSKVRRHSYLATDTLLFGLVRYFLKDGWQPKSDRRHTQGFVA